MKILSPAEVVFQYVEGYCLILQTSSMLGHQMLTVLLVLWSLYIINLITLPFFTISPPYKAVLIVLQYAKQ